MAKRRGRAQSGTSNANSGCVGLVAIVCLLYVVGQCDGATAPREQVEASPIVSPPIATNWQYTTVPVRLRDDTTSGASVVRRLRANAPLNVISCAHRAQTVCAVVTYEGQTGYVPKRVLASQPLSVPYVAPRTDRTAVPQALSPRASARAERSRSNGYYTGPRGGCYTYSASGRKRYVDHSYCQ